MKVVHKAQIQFKLVLLSLQCEGSYLGPLLLFL